MQKYRIEIKWAFLFALMSCLWMLGERMAGLHDRLIEKHAVYTNLVAIPAVLLYILAMLDKRRHSEGGLMTYRQAFLFGLRTTLIIAILTPLTQYITSTYITPDYFDNMSNYAVQQGKMTEEAAKTYFSLGSYMVQAVVGALVMGLLTSALVAVFMQKK